MKLYYYRDKIGNFGDDLNVWLWEKLLPGYFNDDDSAIFVGIGTLLNSLLPKTPYKIVFSSGVGYKDLPPPVDTSWNIYCVRGPLSAKKLGIDESLAVTDGAALLNTLDFPAQEKQHNITFIPHHKSHRDKWQVFCRKIGINYINPSENVDYVLSEINRSKLVLAESMHGAIVADTFRVPWIPVKLHDHILDFKWDDWCRSMGVDYKPFHLPETLNAKVKNKYAIWLKYAMISMVLRNVAAKSRPVLSSIDRLETVSAQLHDKLQQFKKDFPL